MVATCSTGRSVWGGLANCSPPSSATARFACSRPGCRGWRRIDKADHRLQPAVIGDDSDIGPLDIKRRLRGSAGDPGEADILVMRLDAAGERQAITRMCLLRLGDHRVDPAMARA